MRGCTVTKFTKWRVCIAPQICNVYHSVYSLPTLTADNDETRRTAESKYNINEVPVHQIAPQNPSII